MGDGIVDDLMKESIKEQGNTIIFRKNIAVMLLLC
ncbi:Uncharacterised protein [Niallia circulans]|jgi:hypothetical protein|nr:Uncharacterised protein [Niallia circulans]